MYKYIQSIDNIKFIHVYCLTYVTVICTCIFYEISKNYDAFLFIKCTTV